MATEDDAQCPECSAVVVDMEHHRKWHNAIRERLAPLGKLMVPDEPISRQVTVVLNLPIKAPVVVDLLDAVIKHFPRATFDTSHPEGWRIEVGPDESDFQRRAREGAPG